MNIHKKSPLVPAPVHGFAGSNPRSRILNKEGLAAVSGSKPCLSRTLGIPNHIVEESEGQSDHAGQNRGKSQHDLTRQEGRAQTTTLKDVTVGEAVTAAQLHGEEPVQRRSWTRASSRAWRFACASGPPGDPINIKIALRATPAAGKSPYSTSSQRYSCIIAQAWGKR